MSATVQLVEWLGAAQQDYVVTYLNIHGDDSYSDYATSYLDHSIISRTDGSPTYSMERWCRFRFMPPFGTVRAMRFWASSLTIPTGWTLQFGTSSAFGTPTNSLSSYAISDLPTSDPGMGEPNVGNLSQSGDAVRYSDWIILQASANGEAATGPMEGFDTNNHPLAIQYHFNWTET